MITLQDYLDFWNKDLVKAKPTDQIRGNLDLSIIVFVERYGLPSIDRIFSERKKFLEETSVLPHIFLSKTNIEDNIKQQRPFFEFETSLSDKIIFKEQEFVRIGVEANRDLVIELQSGNIHCISRTPHPELGHVDFPIPIAQNLFVNSDIEKFGLSFTAEFLAKRKLVIPKKRIVNSYETKNVVLRVETEKEIEQIINDLENELKMIDPAAFELTSSYWIHYFLDVKYPG
jgi:hypothetical protein